MNSEPNAKENNGINPEDIKSIELIDIKPYKENDEWRFRLVYRFEDYLGFTQDHIYTNVHNPFPTDGVPHVRYNGKLLMVLPNTGIEFCGVQEVKFATSDGE